MSNPNKRGGGKGKPIRGGKGKPRDGGARGRNSSTSGARLSGSNIGRVLRTAYDDALREPVPDEFLNLLGKLD